MAGPLTQKKISVVVPCYRDEDNIHELLRRLQSTLERVAPNYEIIYINDNSPGNAREILDEVAKQDPRVTVIHHSRNFGLMGVYSTGLRQAVGDAVVLMDGDLQDPPELIEQFVEKWNQGYLVAYGTAIKRKEEKALRRLGMHLFYRLWNRVAPFYIPEDSGDFSLIDRRVVDIINALPEKDRMFRGLRAWVGFPQVSVPFERAGRFAGETTQSYLSYFSFAGFAVTSFSYLPLRIISILALVATGVSILFFFFLLSLFIFDVRGPRGFMTIISLILFSSSAIFVCLSIIAEYLIRIFIEIKARPESIIGEIRNDHRGIIQ